MTFLLSSENVLAYLERVGLHSQGACNVQITPKPGKNFNLRVSAPGVDVLVKQEPRGLSGQATGEVAREWAFYRLLEEDARLGAIQSLVPTPLYFDKANAIIVLPYLDGVCDLSEYYRTLCKGGADGVLPIEGAIALGSSFAVLHAQTFESFASVCRNKRVPDFMSGLGRLSPEEFCGIPSNALKFFRFYQRYPEIAAAIATLNKTFAPSCIVHDDPRFANVLINCSPQSVQPKGKQTGLETSTAQPGAYLIDWEKWKWGDPAYDLGRLVSNYLKLWLKSVPISSQMAMSESLDRATVPLSALQPSLSALMRTYLRYFPQIVTKHPDYITRVIQFAGLGLIQQVVLYIVQKRPIGNVEMAFVQVAKSLLCQPQALIPTVFGETQDKLLASLSASSQNSSGGNSSVALSAQMLPVQMSSTQTSSKQTSPEASR